MKLTSTLTKYFILGTAVVITAFDIAAFFTGGLNTTISYNLWYLSKGEPMIPFAVGVLCGHLFWQLGNP